MSPVTHFLAGWMVANFADRRRDRILITLAGVAPDLDGLGIVPELITARSSHPLTWFSDYHHLLGHNIGFALLTTLAAYAISGRRWKIAALAFLSFHLHLLCDLVGARGPDGYQWPIPYLLPFSNRMDLAWKGQWMLNAWPNFAFTIVLLVGTFYLAWKRGFSPLEIFSANADRAFVNTLRDRFRPSQTTAPTTPA
jgi:inner membrane protein